MFEIGNEKLAISVASDDVGRDLYAVSAESTFCPTTPSSQTERSSELLNPVMLQMLVQTSVDFSKVRACVENPSDETLRVAVIDQARAQKHQPGASCYKCV
jgi:hypothetical protein